jgi:putative peptidoglycan lipid II flippase
MARLYATTLFALQDTRTPQRCAIARVIAGGALGVTGAFWGARALGLDTQWSVAFLSLGSAMAAWLEFALLRRFVVRRIGETGVREGTWWRIMLAALVAAAAGVALHRAIGDQPGLLMMLAILAVFAIAYGGMALVLRVPEAASIVGALRRRL